MFRPNREWVAIVAGERTANALRRQTVRGRRARIVMFGTNRGWVVVLRADGERITIAPWVESAIAE
jgi:hypothetical protein